MKKTEKNGHKYSASLDEITDHHENHLLLHINPTAANMSTGNDAGRMDMSFATDWLGKPKQNNTPNKRLVHMNTMSG